MRGSEDLSEYRWSHVAAQYVAVYEAALAGTGPVVAATAA